MTDGDICLMDDRRADDDLDDLVTTDDVLSESVERVRSSRELMDQIDQQLARGQELLGGDQPTLK